MSTGESGSGEGAAATGAGATGRGSGPGTAERTGSAAGTGGSGGAGGGRGRLWFFGLLPVVLVAGVVAFFLWQNPMSFLEGRFPPVEELTIERVTFPEEGTMKIHVVNGGPEPVTVAQVLVDEAYWEFSVDGSRTIPRLERRTFELPYPWVEGEPHEVTLITSTGLTFSHEVEVATLTPRSSGRLLATFALLGTYAGVVPVLIGLLWFPFLRRLDRKWIHFFLSFTVGLLVFLAVDGFHEAVESAGRVAEAFQGIGLVALGVLGSYLALEAFGSWGEATSEASDEAAAESSNPSNPGSANPSPEASGAARDAGSRPGGTGGGPASRLRLAYLIALGIGLHNLGEGLAIGGAYAAGELALGSFLVIGFALHNTTEGLGIVAPVAEDRPSLWHLAAMGAVAGAPTILGTWIGGFSYSPIATTLFLALGVGAILQVAAEIGKLVARRDARGLFAPLNAAGLAAGLLVMYATAMFVVA